jgi:3-(3-hydroxy-phenyl)propionate hydroxylase
MFPGPRGGLFDESDWSSLAVPIRRNDVALDDRLPKVQPGRQAIADADGQLESALQAARNRFVVVKPDRYVAAVFGPREVAAVGSRLREALATT